MLDFAPQGLQKIYKIITVYLPTYDLLPIFIKINLII